MITRGLLLLLPAIAYGASCAGAAARQALWKTKAARHGSWNNPRRPDHRPA